MEPSPDESSADAREFLLAKVDKPVTRMARWGCLPGFLTLVIATSAQDPTEHPALLGAGFGTLFLCLSLMMWGQKNETPRRAIVQARASARGLFVKGKQWVHPDRIQNAFITPEAKGATVTMRGRFRNPAVWVPAESDADALLEALGLTPATRAPTFPLGTSMMMPFLIIFLVGFPCEILFHDYPLFGRALPMLMPGLMPLALLWRRTVTVATDGVSIGHGTKSEFVPYSEIERVQHTGTTILLHRFKEKWVRIEVRTGGYFQGPKTGVEVVAAAIEKAAADWKTRAAARAEPAFEPIVLTTNGDGLHYRVPSVPRERLLEVVEDTTVDVRVRVAAAEALADEADVDLRLRLERAAATSASPELRRALAPSPRR